MDPTTFDYGTVAGKLLENTPMTALMGFALWAVVKYLKEMLASHAAEIKALHASHAAEIKALHEKHDTERVASQNLLLDLTKGHITSSNALTGVIEKMEQRLCEHGDQIAQILSTLSQKVIPKRATT